MNDLESIKARAAAATPGPWYPSGFGWNIVSAGEDGVSVSERKPQTYCDGAEYNPKPDADFIAHARIDVPALVAEVEQLRAALLAVDSLGLSDWDEGKGTDIVDQALGRPSWRLFEF